MNFSHVTLFVATWLLTLGAAIGQEKVDYDVVDRIRDEGFNRSRVMELASWMTDVYGPRFANTLTYDQAAKWAKQKFEEFGVGKVEIEAWGRTWVCTTGWFRKT
jgi:hypothetical protein